MSSIYTARIDENINRKHGKSTVILSKIKDSMGIVIKQQARYDYLKNSNVLGNYKKGDCIEFICGFTEDEIDFIAGAKIIDSSFHSDSTTIAIIKDPYHRKYFTRLENGKLVEIKGNDKRFNFEYSCNDRAVEEEGINKLEIFFDFNTEN
jgi:hypothetical protein